MPGAAIPGTRQMWDEIDCQRLHRLRASTALMATIPNVNSNNSKSGAISAARMV